MNELSIARQFIEQVLLAGDIEGIGGEIYTLPADEDAADPFVSMTHMGGAVQLGTGGEILFAEPLYLVTVHGRGDETTLGDLGAIAADVDVALTAGGEVTVSGHTVTCWRDPRGAFEQSRTDANTGVVWHRTGAYYRFFIQAA